MFLQITIFAAFVLGLVLAPCMLFLHAWDKLRDKGRRVLFVIAVLYYLVLFIATVKLAGGGEMNLAPWI